MAAQRVHLIAGLLAVLAPAVAQCQTENALWRFVPPDAKALISINWERIRQAPSVAMLRQKLLAAPLTASIPGLDLLDDVDRVLITAPAVAAQPDADATTSGAAAAGESGGTPVLIAIHGHFEAAKLHHFFTQLSAKVQAYNSFQVYRPQGKGTKDMAWVRFDAGTVLFGDAPLVFAALDRNQFAPPAPEPGSIVARAAAMEGAYDFWMSIDRPDQLSGDRLASLFPGSDWATGAQGFDAGIAIRSGLAADLTIRLASEAAARQAVTQLTRAIAGASKDKASEPELREIAKKLKFTSDGASARINVRLTAEDLDKSARAFAAAHPEGVFTAERPVSRPATPLPAPGPPKNAVIRIEGLDSGPVEIPYHQPR